MVSYGSPISCGLNRVSSLGDGSSINLTWHLAYPDKAGNLIAYHIYYSEIRECVFTEGVKYVIIDGSLSANMIGLTPGQEYWFSLRPVEYDPSVITFLQNLPIAHDNVRYYPSSLLSSNISATDTIIPLMDAEGFPSSGIVQIGIELIQYLAVDYIDNELLVPPAGTGIPAHLVEQSNTLYYLPNPNNIGTGTIDSLTLFNSPNDSWTVLCVGIIGELAKFEVIGEFNGNIRDKYTNSIIWNADGYIVASNILTFSITQTSAFSLGDSFLIQTTGAVLGVGGGRGFNNTPATMHTVSGFDGYNTYNPLVSVMAIEEDNRWENIYVCQSRFEYPNFPYTILDGYDQVNQDYLSVDYAAADAANIAFPEYDYSGYHRTDPVLLLNGTCVGSYIGGQMGCIDANGNYNIFRGMSLQTQNTQRQDQLLSLTGQPAVLIKREQTGRICSCYTSNSEYQDDRCPFCFHPDTLINTKDGFRKISEIKVGDQVLSVSGYYQPVLQVFKTPFDGKLKSITTTTTTNPILTTEDHPFLHLVSDHKTKVECGPNSNCKVFINRGDGKRNNLDITKLPSNRFQARVQVRNHNRVSLGTFNTYEMAKNSIIEYKGIHSKPAHRLEWSKAINIKDKDWLVNKWNTKVEDINIINIPQQFLKNTKLGSKRIGSEQFIIDEEFMWIIGIYIAEGSSSKRSISFALHEKETIFQNRIISYFKKHGFNPSLFHSKIGKGVAIEINSTSLAKWFPYLCGHLCHNKKVFEPFMNLPNNKLKSLLQGVYDGDGVKRENEIIQTSEKLCLQLAEILFRLGDQPLISKYINNHLAPSGKPRKQAYRINWKEDTCTRNNRRGHWQFYEQMLTKIKQIKEENYTGHVYNLEVAGDHTYVVQNIAVHNCNGTKFVLGYDQYFNPRRSDGRILVRLGPTAENLKMYEAGLESEFPLDIWTLTVPTIKTRDILILFDQDNNETFRYEVSNVTRNNTILGLDGGQKLSTFRIRKTDPAYQIRVFRDTSNFPSTINTSLAMAVGTPPHSHTIQISEKITAISQINQTTGVSQGHQHQIINGVVMEAFGHDHTIILP